jgi:hypothetical protein
LGITFLGDEYDVGNLPFCGEGVREEVAEDVMVPLLEGDWEDRNEEEVELVRTRRFTFFPGVE